MNRKLHESVVDLRRTILINALKARKGIIVPTLLSIGSLTTAVVGAIIAQNDSNINAINTFVETLSGNSSSHIGGLAILAPLGFAFTAGVASAFNPCGFAMLPAFIGLYLGTSNGTIKSAKTSANLAQNIAKALLIGGVVTTGFVLLFSLVGFITQLARTFVVDILPWLGLLIGIGLAIAGSWLISGGRLYTTLTQRVAARIGNPTQDNVIEYFLFGLSYGIASLSCTLPIFLTIVGTSLAVSTFGTSIRQFLAFSLGMGLVIVALTLGMALFKEAVATKMRKALPYVQPLGSWLMVVAGTYIVFYWLSLGGLLDRH